MKANRDPNTTKENNAREMRVRENNVRETKVNILHTTKQNIFIPKLPPIPDFNTYKNKRKIMVNHLYDNTKKLSIDDLITGEMKTTWLKILENGLGRL